MNCVPTIKYKYTNEKWKNKEGENEKPKKEKL